MPRQARTASGTGIYHIMMRGVNRRNIFDDDEDRKRFVQILDGLPFNYRNDGRYTIDNLEAERTVRPITRARKSSLHHSSEDGLQMALAYM